MDTFILGYVMHIIPVISAHSFPLCFFANPSLHIRVSCLCISFSIYEARPMYKDMDAHFSAGYY